MTEDDLLKWLAQEDSSAYGECRGETFDALVEKGFAEFLPAAPPLDRDRARVRLTEAGAARARRTTS